jgi:hypothetical protein
MSKIFAGRPDWAKFRLLDYSMLWEAFENYRRSKTFWASLLFTTEKAM